MKVDLNLSEQVKEPYVVIHASEITPEISELTRMISGFGCSQGMLLSFFFCLCSAVKGEKILIFSVMAVELCLLPEYIAFLLSPTGMNILHSDISERNP